MAFWLYILKCRDGSYYTGHTDDLERRMAEHYSGTVPGYASDRMPVDLVWAAEFPTRIEALRQERAIKTWSRKKKEALIAQDWEQLRKLSKKVFKKSR